MDIHRRQGILLLVGLLLPLWACGGTPEAESAEEAAGADTAAAAGEAPDAGSADAAGTAEEEAAAATSSGQAERTAPARTPPREPRPSPTVTVTLPVGTEFPVSLNDSLDTRRLEAGRRFTATVDQAVATDARVVIPSGSEVVGRVTEVRQPRGDSVGVIVLSVDSVRVRGEPMAVTASVVDAEVESRSEMTDEGAKIGGGAAAGAIIGAIAGKDVKSAIIGAAGGAAAGTAIAMGTKNRYGVLPRGAVLRLRLDEPVTATVPR